MIYIYQEKEQFVYYRFSSGIREEQYVVLESLYLQMALVNIFAYIYTYIPLYIDIDMHIDG
jgi:hypothetical protein